MKRDSLTRHSRRRETAAIDRRSARDDPPRALQRTTRLLTTALLTLVLTPGCAGYRWGTRTLYRPDIRTVHVPVFQSDSFRRNLGERLTEAVVNEIQTKTPYRLASAETADSTLRGRIISETKRVVAEDYFDNPRLIETDFVVQIDWTSPQGNLLTNAITIPLPDYVLRVGQAESIIAEGGQSVATAHQKAIEQLAEQIVAQMEMAPW